MITKTDRKTLKKLLGANYAEEVLNCLNEKKITNQQGNPHKVEYICKVMNGVRNNRDIEIVFWQLAAEKKNELDSLKNSVKSKKPEAVTSGL